MAAVLHKEKICACTPDAQASGVQVGMRRSTVLGLVPHILLSVDNPTARQQHVQEAALALLQYTPNLAFLEQDAIVLEVSGSLSLFKGPRRLLRRIHITLDNMGIRARAGMAPTAQGAWILASQTQTRRRRVLRKQSLARCLDPLPVHVLPAAVPHLEWLSGIACSTLGQLQNLPRSGLQQRSSPLLMQAIDAAYGRTEQYFPWFEAPETFSQHYELLQHIEHTNAVLVVAQRLIEQLCGWLHARQLALHALVLSLHHEKGRHAQSPTLIPLRLSAASWLVEDFLNVLGEQLQTVTLKAPVISIGLTVSQTAPRPAASASLFPEPSQWLRQEHRLLDLLRARLGDDHILQPQPRASYLPERANGWAPVNDRSPDAATPPRLGAQSRPFWLLPFPVPLVTHGDHPVYKGSRLRLIQGPERLETGWWTDTGHELRDYFVAQDSHGARYWIYRERESLDACWFLHGLFA